MNLAFFDFKMGAAEPQWQPRRNKSWMSNLSRRLVAALSNLTNSAG
jgi:hypothetical protein